MGKGLRRDATSEMLAFEDAAWFALQLADKTELSGRYPLDRRRLQRLRIIEERCEGAQRSSWKLGMRGPYSPRLARGLETLEDAGAIHYAPGLVTSDQLRNYARPERSLSQSLETWL